MFHQDKAARKTAKMPDNYSMVEIPGASWMEFGILGLLDRRLQTQNNQGLLDPKRTPGDI